MTIIEGVALMQRILSSAKEEAMKLNTVESASIKGKLEVLEGEMNLFRSACEELFASPEFVADPAPVEEQTIGDKLKNAKPEEVMDFIKVLQEKADNGEIPCETK